VAPSGYGNVDPAHEEGELDDDESLASGHGDNEGEEL